MKFSVKSLAYMALMIAVMAVCAWITIPVYVVPFTMQTFAVFVTLLLLGGKNATFAILAYLLLGAIGVPVFSGMRGGFGVLAGPTGGYLIGFLCQGLLYWLFDALKWKKLWQRIVALAAGLVLCYLFGTVFFTIWKQGAVGFGAALGMCVLPYIIPDLAKMVLAVAVAKLVSKAVKDTALRDSN